MLPISHFVINVNYMNGITLSLLKMEISIYYVIVQLPDIRPQLWHDVIPQQIEWQNQLITYDATKMDGAYSDGITPLFQ